MAENPNTNETQPAVTPPDQEGAAAGDNQPASTPSAEQADMAAGTGAAGETSSNGAMRAAPQPGSTPTRETTDAAPAADDVDVSAEEVEAAMQEMLTAAEPPAADDARGAGRRAVPADLAAAAKRAAPDGPGRDPAPLPPNAAPFQAPDFSADGSGKQASPIELLDDVELDVKIELGRTEMFIEDVLGLGAGSVVALDKAAGDPVDIFVNDRLVARGEVLVLNDNFCVRINDILSPIPELEREE